MDIELGTKITGAQGMYMVDRTRVEGERLDGTRVKGEWLDRTRVERQWLDICGEPEYPDESYSGILKISKHLGSR